MRARGAKRRAQRGALLCGLLLAGCGGLRAPARAPAPAPPIIGVPDTGLEDTGLRPARGAPSGSPLETPDGSAPVPAGLPADCGLERMTPPHWSKALPWLIADPRLETGITVEDPDVAEIRGAVTADGAFYMDVLLRENATYERFEMEGITDQESGAWDWVLRSVGKEGWVHERVIAARWEGCRWQETYLLELPFYGEVATVKSDSYLNEDYLVSLNYFTIGANCIDASTIDLESVLFRTGRYQATLREYHSSIITGNIYAEFIGSTLEQTIKATTSSSCQNSNFCSTEYDSCEITWSGDKIIYNPCTTDPHDAISPYYSYDGTFFPPRHIWRP